VDYLPIVDLYLGGWVFVVSSVGFISSVAEKEEKCM